VAVQSSVINLQVDTASEESSLEKLGGGRINVPFSFGESDDQHDIRHAARPGIANATKSYTHLCLFGFCNVVSVTISIGIGRIGVGESCG